MRNFIGIQQHNISNTLIDGIEMIDNPYFHILEFGVASGNTLVQIVESVPQNKYEIFGFDSWEGLPEDWYTSDGVLLHDKGTFSTNGVLPQQVQKLKDKVTILHGWFDDTIPRYLNSYAKDIALLHIDSDLYSSAKSILYGLINYIKPGTIIVFDEWSRMPIYVHGQSSNFIPIPDQEQILFYEWVKDFNVKYKFYPVKFESQRKLVKILNLNI